MAPQSDQLNERFAGTFRKLLDTIERGSEQCSTDRLQTFLEEKSKQLSLALDTFGEPSTQSRNKLTSGNVSVDGKTINLTQGEKNYITLLSDIFHINELSCASLWSAFRQEHKVNVPDDKLCEDIHLMDRVTRFYFDERICLLQCVASLLRIHDDVEHVFSSIADYAISRIVKDDFVERIIKQFKRSVRAQVPTRFQTRSETASSWANQNLREQKSLLEIICLIYPPSLCSPQRVLALIQEFEANSFGRQQATMYALDHEGAVLLEEVSHMCVLTSVAILRLPFLRPVLSIRPKGENLLDAPDVLVKIGQVAHYLGDKPEHSVFLLAWSYLLSYIDNLLPAEGCPQPYLDLEHLIHGKLELSNQYLLKEGPSRSIKLPENPVIAQSPRVYERFAGRSLKLGVFDHMSSIIQSRTCGVSDEEGADNSGNRQVLKELLNAFLSTTPPVALHSESYGSLVQCVRLLFLDQAELCLQFWKSEAESNALLSLVETARGGFPVDFLELVQLLSSLSGAGDHSSASKESARCVVEYFKYIPTLTTELKANVNLQLRSEDEQMIAFSNDPIRLSSAINEINGVSVPAGTLGTLIPGIDERRIVRWRINYSGWHLIAVILATFIERQKTNNFDRSQTNVEDADLTLEGQNIEVINSILELLHRVFQACPGLVPELVNHVEEIRNPAVTASGPYILISLLCQVLSICCSIEPCPVNTTNLALQCVTSLLPHYRTEIWTYLETAPILPRPNAGQGLSARFPVASRVSTDPNCQIQHIVANVECKKGEYTLLLAFLNLVTALVRDVQRHWWIHPQQTGDNQWIISRQYQIETLYLCLHYLMLDVFPSYANWRYRWLSQRFRIGSKVISIFIEIAQYFRDPDAAAVSRGLSLDKLREDILFNFLYEGGAYHVEPLLEVLSAGAKKADFLYRAQRFGEAKLAERLTIQTFEFIKILLQRQLEAIARGDNVRESTLERMILERPNETSAPDFLLRLTRHINYRHNAAIPILATNIVTLLCRTSQTWANPPDFVGHLGDKEQVQSIIKTYLSIAQDQFQSERLLTSIWQMIILLLETQPSLGLLFLECGENILPSPKSAIKLMEEQKKQQQAASRLNQQPPVESAIRVAIDSLSHWEMLSMEKPTVLSNLLRFLATFWQTAFQHHALLQRTRSDSALWDALGKILLNPTNMEIPRQEFLELYPTENISIDDDMDGAPLLELSSNNKAVRRVCCLNVSKAFALRIMAFEIHLTACSHLTATSIADQLPAGIKTLLGKISDQSKLAALRSSAIKNSFNQRLPEDVKNVAEDLLQKVGGSGTSSLLYKVGPIGYGDNDAEDQPRQYGDLFLYDLRIAEARINNLVKEIADKYQLEEHDDIIVTPAVLAVRKVKATADRLKTNICLANHNSSLVDSEIILLRSFKTFIETCSGHASDIFWGSKASNAKSTVLFEFIKSVLQHAANENRDDGVTLTIYATLIEFLRGLTEDWISLVQDGLAGRQQQHIDEIVSLLEGNCRLLLRDNFSLVDSVRGYTAVSFHRPLLETNLLLLRTLRKASSGGSRDPLSVRIKDSLLILLNAACESLQLAATKATSFIAAGIQGEQAEECIKDCTVITAIVMELINKTYQPDANEWLPSFSRYEIIPSLLRLLHDGIGMEVNEIDRQISSGGQNLYVSRYAENALYLLLIMSGNRLAAEQLLRQGLIDVLCHNPLTPILQQGSLDLLIRFQEGSGRNQKQAVYVERNPLHVTWCHMLFVVSNMMRSLVDDNKESDIGDRMLRSTVAFLQMYASQIQRTFATAKGERDSLMGLSPSESLSSCHLEEIERITMIIFGLAKRFDRVVSYAANIFIAFGDFALSLLQRYLYYFTHPQHMQAQLYPINHIERQLAEQFIPSSLSASTSTVPAANKTSRLLQSITQKIVRIQPNIMLALMQLTEVQKILTERDVEWPFGNTILEPNSRVGDKASFGTMIECINAGIILLKAEHHGKSKQIARGLLYLIEGCAVLLTTQTALWIAKPELTDDVRQELADDNLIDVVNTLTKLFIGLDKAELPFSLKQGKDMTMVQAETLKRFLTDRYFGSL